MASNACYTAAAQAFEKKTGAPPTDKQLEGLMAEAERMVKRMKRAYPTTADAEAAIAARVGELGAAAKANAIIEKRNAALTLRAKGTIRDYLNRFSNPVEGIQALLGGINKPVAGARLSVDAQQQALGGKWVRQVLTEFEDAGIKERFFGKVSLFGVSVDRDFHLRTMQEWENLSLKRQAEGFTKDKDALKAAKILESYYEQARTRENRAGAFIGKLPGRTVSHGWDQYRLRKAGRQQFVDSVVNELDLDRAFGGQFAGLKPVDPEWADLVKAVGGAFDGLESGVHLKFTEGLTGQGPSGVSGSLAKGVSQHRLLVFKDAAADYRMMKQFGRAELPDQVMADLRGSARDAVLMESLGPNPRATLEAIVTDLRQNNRLDPKLRDKLKLENTSIAALLRQVDGTSSIPGSPTLAKIGSNVRAVESMSKLGGALASQISDLGVAGAQGSYIGMNDTILSGIGAQIGHLFTSRGPQERKILASLSAGQDGIIGAVGAHFGAVDSPLGTMSRMQMAFFRLNGMSWWTEALRDGNALSLSHYLHLSKGDALGKIDQRLARELNRYDIGAKEWDLIRQLPEQKAGGRGYLTTDGIQALSHADVEGYLGKTVSKVEAQRFRDGLENKLSAFFQDQTAFAVLEPDAKVRAWLQGNTVAGTPSGEFARFFWQFKAFSGAYMDRVVGRRINGGDRPDVVGLAAIAAISTIAGYFSSSIKDVLRGQQPVDPTGEKWSLNIMRSAAQGGGLGIMGDFFLADYNRVGKGLAETFGGPAIGDAFNIATIAVGGGRDVLSGKKDFEDVGAKALQQGVSITPFMNLFYVKPAVDYLAMYGLQEAVNPGYLRRMEKRTRQQQGREFIFPPSAYAQRY